MNTTTNNRYERVAHELYLIEAQLKAEAEKKRLGQPALGVGEQISLMLKQIAVMRQQIESRSLPPVDQRVRGMAMMVVDSWPMDEPFGEQIVAVEHAYLKLK